MAGVVTAAAHFPARIRRRLIAPRLTWRRWVAKNIVASGLADIAEIQFAYAIGYPDPCQCLRRYDGHRAKLTDAKIANAVHQSFRLQARRHRFAAPFAPPDLSPDHELRTLRQSGAAVGADEQSRRSHAPRPSNTHVTTHFSKIIIMATATTAAKSPPYLVKDISLVRMGPQRNLHR